MKDRISRILAVAGLALLVAGVTLYGIRLRGDAVVLGLGISGIGMLIACAALNWRWVLDLRSRRSARQGTNAVLMSVFFATILVLIQAISVRNSYLVDLTRNQRFTLAPQTLQLLSQLDRDVTVQAFYRHNSPIRNQASNLLALYQSRTSRLTHEIIDPDTQPRLAQELGAGYENAVVTSGEHVRLLDVLNEETLTNAILQVTLDVFKTVYFVSGHNEKNIASQDRAGYSSAREGLEGEGYIVHELSLVDVEQVPDDCDVLVIAGPRHEYFATEVARIRRYLDDGGSALFLLDPQMDLPNIASLLSIYNLELLDAVMLDELVVDAGDRIFDATVTKVRTYERHPVTRNFKFITMFPMARPIRIVEGSPDRVAAQYLAATEPTTWAETDPTSFKVGQATPDGDDIPGPLPIAVAAERYPPIDPAATDPRPTSRIIVVGDSDFANNSFYGLLGNSDFFLNSVNYLAQDENLIAIRSKEALGDSIYITEAQGRLIFAVCIILLPLSSVVVGSSVLWRRRRL